MPKIRKPPPKRILDHLIKRFREGRISWKATKFSEQGANGAGMGARRL